MLHSKFQLLVQCLYYFKSHMAKKNHGVTPSPLKQYLIIFPYMSSSPYNLKYSPPNYFSSESQTDLHSLEGGRTLWIVCNCTCTSWHTPWKNDRDQPHQTTLYMKWHYYVMFTYYYQKNKKRVNIRRIKFYHTEILIR